MSAERKTRGDIPPRLKDSWPLSESSGRYSGLYRKKGVASLNSRMMHGVLRLRFRDWGWGPGLSFLKAEMDATQLVVCCAWEYAGI